MPISKSKNGKRVGDVADPRTLMTIEDVQRMGTFFKDLLESSHLKTWIILAGVGGIAAVVATLIEIARAAVDIYMHYHPS